MKKVLLFCITFLILKTATAQLASNYAVQLTASVQNSPPSISLKIVVDNTTFTGYNIYRKLKGATTWGSIYATLPATDSVFTDTAVAVKVSYEYKVVRNGTPTAYGYINSGIVLPEVSYYGKIIVMVDSALAATRTYVNQTYINDLIGDGWLVIKKEVDRNTAVTDVKDFIVDQYHQDPGNIKAVVLIGHVPVPYSGDLNPDGHPDHLGAWPADAFYGEIDGNWTDASINDTVSTGSRNDNIPGDGKYDQTLLPSEVELQVGRIDMANMPAFSTPEDSLVLNYLKHDHDFRTGQTTFAAKALIDDNFGAFSGEAFAASAWKNFAPLVGPTRVSEADYFTTMDTASYIWSYGCGGGSYTSCSGVGNTSTFVHSNLQTAFTMLFGSYFGDWDSQNNFLRAPLTNNALASCWSGRPHWVFHHMGMGETIGYSAMTTQNNTSLYFQNYAGSFVHIALMGDPTLRQYIVAPPQNLTVTETNNIVSLSWTASTDGSVGYSIYRSNDLNTPFTLISSVPGAVTFFADSCVDMGSYIYMVRASKTETTTSGSFGNLSNGIMGSINVGTDINIQTTVTANTSADTLFTTNNTTGATSYEWSFGDGNTSTEAAPTHIYSASGTYTVTLTASNNCNTKVLQTQVTVVVSSINELSALNVNVAPNPFNTSISVKAAANQSVSYRLFDFTGKLLQADKAAGQFEINTGALAAGIYFLELNSNGATRTFKLVRE